MQRRDVSLESGPAHDLNVRTKPPAIDRQINVHVIVVGGDDHCGRIVNARLFEDAQLCSAAPHKAVIRLHNVMENVIRLRRLRRSAHIAMGMPRVA